MTEKIRFMNFYYYGPAQAGPFYKFGEVACVYAGQVSVTAEVF